MGVLDRIVDLVKRAYVALRTDTRNSTLRMGRGSRLNVGCVVRGPVSVGRYCAIGRDVTFQGRNHRYDRPGIQVRMYRRLLDTELGFEDEAIDIGSDVWIGSKAILLPGVHVGHGAIIGAGAVVANDVQPYEIVVGVPAERVGWRFPEHVREQLLDISWWDWTEERIRRNRAFFETGLDEPDEAIRLSDHVD